MSIEAANGGKYDYLKHKDVFDNIGTLRRSNLNGTLKAYRGKDYELALIRFIFDDNNYLKQSGDLNNYKYDVVSYDGLTDASVSRLKYNKIDIEKIVEISDGLEQNQLVNLGENLTYKITIKNNSDSVYSSFDVVENIDSRLNIIDNGGGIFNNNELKWVVDKLLPGESKNIEYTVNVPNDKKLLGDIILSFGRVDKIATSKVEVLVGNKFSQAEKSNLVSSFDLLKNNSSVERSFINDIYKDAFGVELGLDFLSNKDIISYDKDISSSGGDKLSVKRTKINDTSVLKYIYQNFYGLRLFSGVKPSVNSLRDCPDSELVRIVTHWNFLPNYEFNDRVRTIDSNMLIDGDIILLYTNDESMVDDMTVCPVEELEDRAYIYIGGKLIRKISNSKYEELSGEDLTIFLRDIIGENFVMLRPSIAMVDNDDIDKEDVNVNENSGQDFENIVNPETGNNFIYFVIGFLFVSMFSIILTYNQYKFFDIK